MRVSCRQDGFVEIVSYMSPVKSRPGFRATLSRKRRRGKVNHADSCARDGSLLRRDGSYFEAGALPVAECGAQSSLRASILRE